MDPRSGAVYSAKMLDIAPMQDPYAAFVSAYYEEVLHSRANPRIHSVKIVGDRDVRGRSAKLVCVSYTMQLRFGGDHDMTEALFFVGEEVIRRTSGNEALNLCAVF